MPIHIDKPRQFGAAASAGMSKTNLLRYFQQTREGFTEQQLDAMIERFHKNFSDVFINMKTLSDKVAAARREQNTTTEETKET